MHRADFVTEAEVAEAAAMAHHLERTLLLARIERLTALVREHGLALPPDDTRLGVSDGEHLAACRLLVTTAYEMLEAIQNFDTALHELRALVGSGMELVGGESWATRGAPCR